MYRLMMESIIGMQLDVDKLRFAPHVPSHWPSFVIHYRYRGTVYHITITNGGDGKSIKSLVIDGVGQSHHEISLVNDNQNHHVAIELE
jgi:cellobiose phosphorylase